MLPVLRPEIRLWVEMRKEKQLHERVEACEQEIAALKSQRHCPASERQDTAHGNGLALGFRQVSMPARRVCRGERVQLGL